MYGAVVRRRAVALIVDLLPIFLVPGKVVLDLFGTTGVPGTGRRG